MDKFIDDLRTKLYIFNLPNGGNNNAPPCNFDDGPLIAEEFSAVNMPPSTTKEDLTRELATIGDPTLDAVRGVLEGFVDGELPEFFIVDVANQLRELVCFGEKKQEN
jgi:hypothetical protein